MILPYVYKLTHKSTSQFYFGYREGNSVSSNLDLGVIYFSSSKYIKEIGFDNFDFEIIAEFFNPLDAYEYEQSLIKNQRKNLLCLNRHFTNGKEFRYIRLPGTYKTSEVTKQKQSLAHKGKIVSQETRAKISAIHKGKIVSAKSKSKISLAGKGRIVTSETREKISKARTGVSRSPFSENTKQKMSESAKTRIRKPRGPMSEETKEKLRQKALNLSSETREKLRESSHKRWFKCEPAE